MTAGPRPAGGPRPSTGHRRGIVSYVRRTTRLTETQQHAWDRFADRWVVPVPEGPRETSVDPSAEPFDLAALFGRDAPLAVEIGSGSGESLVAMAAARPELDVLAFEVYQPAVASTLSRINRAGVDNVRVVMADAVEGLTLLLGPDALSELWLFFPDPWHKLKHRKRRLVTSAFADLVAARMRPGGQWHLATDWQDYANQMLRVLTEHEAFENLHEQWAPRWEARPVTKFEAKGTAAGRTIRDLTFRRR
ncbi:tRNA (guanosine(46)-N7)-methyltransferase TrmB [Desertihabitans brevis]|uniref:tRNA (guanine-N(7)-)-methyltransferase n=1 Tax=Desertihabitans brevis TaxID=2268447 RepID=A0A367YVM0_9ACTN|nr:tRNA (guanosine(46)-N7)-methyltransferase TrmB [Desertihabitans brevis]RCK69797.1 tRNA (guanosine(46)-N7)-methyltransferase TrmB [Desertihabitans brevis]